MNARFSQGTASSPTSLPRDRAARPAGAGSGCRAQPMGASAWASPAADRVRPGRLRHQLAKLMRSKCARLRTPPSTTAGLVYQCVAAPLPTRSPINSSFPSLQSARCARPDACARVLAYVAALQPRSASTAAAWGADWLLCAHDQTSRSRAPTLLTRSRSTRAQAQTQRASPSSCSSSAGGATVGASRAGPSSRI